MIVHITDALTRARRGEIMNPVRMARLGTCLGVVLLAAACASPHTTPAGSSRPKQAALTSARIVYSVPNNTQDPPWALTGGIGDGVWSWDVGTRSSIDYVTAVTHREHVYRLDASCCGRGVRGYTGLTVGPDGTVWGVLNHTLIELDPTSGHYSATRLPSPPDVEGEPPIDLRTGGSADLVAVSPDGTKLVVGFDDAAAVAVYSLTDGHLNAQPSMLALPRGYFALDIGLLADGTIGVGMERFGSMPEPELLLLRPGGQSTQVRVPDGFGVVADESAFLVGDYRPELVNEQGQVRPVPADFKLPKGDRWILNGGDGGPNRLTALPGGLVARTIGNGLVEVASPARHVLFAMPLQRYPNLPDSCLGCSPPGRATTTTTTLVPPPKWIWRRDSDQQIVSDRVGDLWILTQTPASGIAFAEITAAQLHAAFA